jgi:hypothetical protein
MEWTTNDELEFLKGLGKHRQSTQVVKGTIQDGKDSPLTGAPVLGLPKPRANRKTLLTRYLNSFHMRYDWGSVDRWVVRAAVEDELGC